MPSIYNFKPTFQKIIHPLVLLFKKFNITPNQITIAALLLSFLMGMWIALFPMSNLPMLCLPVVLLLRMMLNALDGVLAREYQMQSSLGIFLNELGDVFSDTFIFLPFSLIPGISAVLIIWIVILSIMTEMAGLISMQIDNKRHYEGPMGKSDRAFVFAVLGLLLGLNFKIFYLINLLLCITIVLLILTIFNRVKAALRDTHAA